MLDDAREIKERATRRLGELMALQAKTVGKPKGGQVGGKRALDGVRNTPSNRPATLSEAGIDKNLAKRARAAASPSEEAFEKMVKEMRVNGGAPKPRRSPTLCRPAWSTDGWTTAPWCCSPAVAERWVEGKV